MVLCLTGKECSFCHTMMLSNLAKRHVDDLFGPLAQRETWSEYEQTPYKG